MKYLIIFLLFIGLSTISNQSYSQCRTRCTISYYSPTTKQTKSNVHMVELKTGWEVWQMTRDVSYKKYSDYIYAIIFDEDGYLIPMRAHKGVGPDLVWSGASPRVNCDNAFWAEIRAIDQGGTKLVIKAIN